MEPNQSKDNSQESEQGCIRIIIETPNMRGVSVPSNGNSTKAAQVLVEPGAQVQAQVQEDQPATSESTPTKREQRAKEKREANIKWRESEIKRCARAACIAKEMTLGLQVRTHMAIAKVHQRTTDALKAGYNLIEMYGYLRAQVIECDAEEYNDPIPHEVITALQTAISTELFDEFSVWTLRKDPILVGKVKEMKWASSFEIARWD